MMKRTMFMTALLAAVLLGTAAFQASYDLAHRIDGVVTKTTVYAGTADTSSSVTLAAYTGAAVIVATGVVDNVAGNPMNVVLQDSSALATWTARDSINVDSVNGKYYDLHYRRTGGVGTKLRLIRRGGASTDSVWAFPTILRVCQRAPC